MAQLKVLGRLGRHDELLASFEKFEGNLGIYSTGIRETLGSLILALTWEQHDLGQDERAEMLFRHVLRVAPENTAARLALLHLYSSDEERAAHASRLEQKWENEEDPYLLLEEGGSETRRRRAST